MFCNDSLTDKYQSQNSTREQMNDSFEINVKPKQKAFGSPQEKQRFIEQYTRKKKTELCKTYQLKGICGFQDQCSFAHGYSELTPKKHLHSNYKTKPCKRFFRESYCPYGPRCQYVHYELKDMDGEYRDFLEKAYRETRLPLPIHPNKLNLDERTDVQRFQHLLRAYGKKLNFQSSELVMNQQLFKRLPFIQELCVNAIDKVEFEQRFLELASRKDSEDLIFDDDLFI